MKYFIDTEFIEGFHKPLFGKRRHYIDLISIAIVAEDGREYYAISTDFNPKNASQWVKDNVISKLPRRHVNFYDSPSAKAGALLWKSNARIAKEIIEFCLPYPPREAKIISRLQRKENDKMDVDGGIIYYSSRPEFYAYYADYDWVVFCSLFGTMMDLPKGFPMYAIDLKQTLDEKAKKMMRGGTTKQNREYNEECKRLGGRFSIDFNNKFEDMLSLVKSHKLYPKQTNEHNALDDAKWNKELYNFLDINPPC